MVTMHTASLFLRAVHGERDFTDQERSDARDRLLDEIANQIAVELENRFPPDGQCVPSPAQVDWS
jgi:hypothetical protein